MSKFTETSITELAAKIESDSPLDSLEKQTIVAILLDYVRQLESRRAGGVLADKTNVGRKRKYSTNSERQKAYLERKRKDG